MNSLDVSRSFNYQQGFSTHHAHQQGGGLFFAVAYIVGHPPHRRLVQIMENLAIQGYVTHTMRIFKEVLSQGFKVFIRLPFLLFTGFLELIFELDNPFGDI